MTLRDYLPLLEASALMALVVISGGLLVWYLERRKGDRHANSRPDHMANPPNLPTQPGIPQEGVTHRHFPARHTLALKLRVSQATGRPEPGVTSSKKRGSELLEGCQLVGCAFLIPWIFTAALVWLFPGFSYGLVERWVCPPGSSIQVEGTGGWLAAVLNDDERVDFPQFACVNSRGEVVFRGDSGDNILAYMRVAGLILLGFLAALTIAFLLIAYSDRKRKIS